MDQREANAKEHPGAASRPSIRDGPGRSKPFDCSIGRQADSSDEYDCGESKIINMVKKLAGISVSRFVQRVGRGMRFSVLLARSPWSLAVEDYTRNDIAVYVRAELATHSSVNEEALMNPHFSELQTEVVKRAQVVRLWVCLVVRDMQKDLDSSETINYLWRRREQFPQLCEVYFDRLLNKIDLINLMEALRIFLLLMEPTIFGCVPLVAPIFIEAEQDDSGYVLNG